MTLFECKVCGKKYDSIKTVSYPGLDLPVIPDSLVSSKNKNKENYLRCVDCPPDSSIQVGDNCQCPGCYVKFHTKRLVDKIVWNKHSMMQLEEELTDLETELRNLKK